MSFGLRVNGFFAVLFAGSFFAAMAFGHAPASASLCATSITTDWSTTTDLGTTGGVDTSETSFTAECSASPSSGTYTSVFSGTYQDQPLSSEAVDTFAYEIFATDSDTLQLDFTATDGTPNGPNTAFPNFTLSLTDIDWGDLDGEITDVDFTSDIAGFGVDNIAASSFDITFDAITFNCNSDSAGRSTRGDGCTYNFSAIFDLTVIHDVSDPNPEPIDVPEPASAGLFLVGLAGAGMVMNRRRRKKAV